MVQRNPDFTLTGVAAVSDARSHSGVALTGVAVEDQILIVFDQDLPSSNHQIFH